MPIGKRIFPVLLSGGAGSRLWPLSREARPKQFLNLVGEGSLLQQAVARVSDPALFEPFTVIASESHRFLVAEQLRVAGARPSAIVLEPEPRNTAAAAAVAALLIEEAAPDALVLLMPTDHRIADIAGFQAALRAAAKAALDGYLTLFGVEPSRPASAYGYIKAGPPVGAEGGVCAVASFVEKPDRETAEGYLASGDYFWNSGIFLMPVHQLMAELERLEPELLADARESMARAARDADFLRLDAEAFGRCRSVSIDHAIMERTERAAVVHATFDWTDVGSWSALYEANPRDDAGNAIAGEVLTVATEDCYIRSDGPLVAAVGVKDLVVVATADAVLVASKAHDEDVKAIVQRLSKDWR